ncbi:uncharacterized protein Bfra_010651 [Botrytis fragariae]|uniref:Protein kinase domain-containing protein n=1 Tax=Botrytis fragariae TaxID=1964551 RepID=A0A8H6AH54_9HELO|nr:uncharacterized protein Bfra_010651 [Botrytis fragariae]KAF5867682.1 hypothetical protein Bfra_010651 [Botrytis fragariae]
MAPPFAIESKAVNYLRAIPTINLRKNPHNPNLALQLEDIQIDFHLRSYGRTTQFGITDTRHPKEPQFDLKLSVITNETGDRTSPPLSPASEDAATSPSEIASKSYNAKRQTEIRVYLRFIKKGHETIKQLEAFHQYRNERGKLILAQFYRLCDAGTVKQFRAVYNAHQGRPPEAFLWKLYHGVIDALAFLHNDHPKTTTKLGVPKDKSFADLTEEQQKLITMDPRRVRPIDHLYSGEFEAMLQRSLVLDHKERPSARELLQELQGPATERGLNMNLFRALPEWIGDEIIPRKINDFAEEHVFSQKRLKELLQPGGLEAEKLLQRNKIAAKKKEVAEKRKREAARNLLGDENPTAFELFYEEWLPREIENGNILDRGEDFECLEYTDEVTKYIMVRRRGIEAGTWVDPGPTWQEVEKLGKEPEAAPAAPPP